MALPGTRSFHTSRLQAHLQLHLLLCHKPSRGHVVWHDEHKMTPQQEQQPQKTYVHNKWLSYVYIILYHNSWTSPWAPPLEWILPKQLLPRGLQQTEIHRIPQGGAPFFSSTASIHTWIPPPGPSTRNASPRRKQKPKKKGDHKPVRKKMKKTYADFCCSNLLWTWMHPVNIQQTSRQFVSLCSHSHVLVTPAPWRKRCEVLHHLARQVATFVQTQQPQDQRVE